MYFGSNIVGTAGARTAGRSGAESRRLKSGEVPGGGPFAPEVSEFYPKSDAFGRLDSFRDA
jgi:hypothetical protein